MIDEKKIFERSENCYLEEMDDDILLYNPSKGMTLHLNPSSALVWKMLDGNSSVIEIVRILEEEYPDFKEQIHGDVINLVQQLVDEDALDEVKPA